MTRNGKPLVKGIAAILLAVAAAAFPAYTEAVPEAGTRAPAFSLPGLGGSAPPVSSAGLFRNRTTLLSFFATWCEPCKKEIAELRRLDERYRPKGFQVVLVCLDIMGARNVRAYLEEAGGTGLQVLCDRKGVASTLYGVLRLPTNVIVGPDEKVREAWDTYRPEKLRELERVLGSMSSAAGSAPGP